MKSLLSVIFVFCAATAASAAIVTTTTCGVGSQFASNPTSCSLVLTNPRASANAAVTINQVTSVPAQGTFNTFTVDVAGSVTAIPYSDIGRGDSVASNATANANISYQFFTGGPVRQGLISFVGFTRMFGDGPGNDSAVATVSVGSLSGSCMGILPSCSGVLLNTTAASPLAFALGNSFNFNFSEAFAAFGDPFAEGTGFASGDVVFVFQLLEADGKTPVAISAAPEPGTLGLLLACFGGSGAIYALRSHHSRHQF